MQEIEVKAALKDRDGVLAKLAELGVTFGPSVIQDDTVYVQNVGSLETFLANSLFLRLRVVDDGRVIFTAKYHENRTATQDTYATELEVDVSSREVMEQILLVQGYKEAVRINKTRMTGRYGEWEVCIDELAGYGSFIEVEQLAPEGADPKQIYDQLCQFLYTLAVAEEDITTMRYDTLLLQAKG